MPKKYFNWKLAIVLVIGLVVLGATAYGLRKWQRSRRAEQGLVLGNKAYDQQNWEEAAKNLGRYLAVAGDDVPTLLKYADAQLNIRPLNRNNLQQAIAAYRTVLRVAKDNSEAAIGLTKLYLEMGMAGEAELIARRVLETYQSPELQKIMAIALANQRKFKEAAEQLETIIKEHPEQISAYDILGQLIERRPGDFLQEDPQFWYNEAVKNNPSSAEAYLIRGAYYLRHNDRSNALADLIRAEQEDLSNTATRLQLAEQFINANDLDKAREHLEAVQSSEPANQLLWQIWARFALRANSKSIMLNIAESGLKELSSQPWDFMPTAAELFILSGELDRADDCISKLRMKDVAPANTAFLEGLLAEQRGQLHEAVKCWYRALQLTSETTRIRLALAGTLSRSGNKQSAIQQLRTLVSEQPNFLSGRLNLVRLLSEAGNWAEAAEQARIAMQISPRSLDAALLYIQARLQLLAESPEDADTLTYRDIEDLLTRLEAATDNVLEVRLLQFQLAMQRGNYTGAEALLTELKETYPSQIKVSMAEVELLAIQDKTEQAVLMLEDIIKKFPEAVEPVRYLAILLAKQNNYEQCEKVIQNALSRIEEPIAQRRLCILQANLYRQWGQQEKEYELLNTFAQKLLNDVPIKQRLLACERVVKNPVKAQQLIDDIKTLEGDEGWQWRYEQARVWFTQSNFQDLYPQIVSLLKENLFSNPDDQASRTLLASAYERAGELRLAISTYDEALNRSPRDINLIVPAVAALYKANEYNRADEILRRVAREKLFHPELKKLELQSYLRRGELGSATDILENILASDPNNRSVCLALSLLKIRQKRFAEADELLRKLKIQEPNSLPIAAAQIEMNIHQNKSAEALLLCDEMINRLNNASSYILRGRTYSMLGRLEKAKEDFEQATALEPNNAASWAANSDFYGSTGRSDMAIDSIKKAMALEPDNLRIYKRAIPLFFVSNDRDKIREGKNILNKALTLYPEDTELKLFQVRSLLTEGTSPAIEEATNILQKITQDQPMTSDAWTLLAEVALMQGQTLKAIDITLQGLVHRPNDKSLLLLKARAEAVRSPALAIPTIKALQELEPNNVDITVLLANTYISVGEPEKAVNLLEKQIVSDGNTPDERKIKIALATALYKKGNKSESQKIFDSLYESEPNDPSPLLAQAQLLKDDQLYNQLSQEVTHWCQNHPKDTHTPITIVRDLATGEDNQAKKTAEDILRMILKNDSDCTEAMGVLAMLLQITNRSAESATIYQQIITLQPDNVIVINNLAWLLCEEQDKYQQALELAQRGLEKDPDYIDLIDTRGVAYYRLGEFDKAVQDFNRCVSLYPPQTPAMVASYFHLARALAKLGQKSQAIESLNKTLDLNDKIGGLSAKEFAEAKRLLEELSEGGR